MMSTGPRALAATACLACLAAQTPAQELRVASHRDPPPQEVAAALRERLATGGARVTVGTTTVDLWWVREAALSAPAAGRASWAQVPEGTLIGAVRFSDAFRDIRGKVIKAGVYTLRYGVQPANGDHLGVSPYREFLLVSPAAVDVEPAPTGHKGTVEMAKQALGTSHPATLSLDPPQADGAPLSVVRNDAGHQSVVFEIAAGGGTLRFGVIMVGRIQA